MSDKKLILSAMFAFGFSCLVIGQEIWSVIHYWGRWQAWLFGGLGLVNVATLVFLVRSHLRWFDAKVDAEYHRGRFEAVVERIEHE